MPYTVIYTYENGTLISEHAYFGDSKISALKRHLREYPEQATLGMKIMHVKDDDPKWLGWFKSARECGCVHCF